MRAESSGAFVVVLLALTACTSGTSSTPPTAPLDDDTITVGSFDFAESAVVAEVYSQALENAGYDVERAFGLGPREFVGPALTTGLIELLPEYAGTAADFYSRGSIDATGDVARTHAALVEALDGGDVVALDAAPAVDSNTFVVTPATATRYNLHSISDLAPIAAKLTFGGPPECRTRRLCLAGLSETYGLTFAQIVALDAGGPITHRALKEGIVDVAVLFTTDPAIEQQGFVELVDDRGLQPTENITPLVRQEVIDHFGVGVADVIDGVSARLTTPAVRDLNGAVESSAGDAAAVAAAWLSEADA